MTIYYRTTDGALRDLTPEQFAALAPVKQAIHRVYIVDPQPTPSSTQAVVGPTLVVGPVEAHQTYSLRDKTAEELAADATAADLAAEGLTVPQLIADIKTQVDIDNTAFNAMTTADKFVVLRQDRRLLLRACRFLLRRMG
jgi:hypothetical protein